MKVIFILGVFVIGIFFTFTFVLKTLQSSIMQDEVISPLAQGLRNFLPNPFSNEYSSLKKIVEKVLNGQEGEYAVVIKNLKTQESYTLNEHKSYISASLYKLWIMATVYGQIEKGTLAENDPLSEDAASLNEKFNIATQEAEITEGTIEYSVNEALERMITISDNYAALLLSSKIRLSNVNSFLKTYYFDDSSLGTPPTTSAYDVAMFFEKVYKGEIISKKASNDMTGRLKRQQLNDRIPKYLPEDVVVAHKTGELDGVKSDGGIVFSKNGDYIIVVLSDTSDPQEAAENTAVLSEKVYEYFNK